MRKLNLSLKEGKEIYTHMQLRHFLSYIITRFVCPVWIASFSPNRDTEHFHWQCTYCHLFTPTYSEYHSILMSTVGIHSHVLDYSNGILFWHSLSSLPLGCLHGLTLVIAFFWVLQRLWQVPIGSWHIPTVMSVILLLGHTQSIELAGMQLHILITIFLHVSIIISL